MLGLLQWSGSAPQETAFHYPSLKLRQDKILARIGVREVMEESRSNLPEFLNSLEDFVPTVRQRNLMNKDAAFWIWYYLVVNE